jgi:hypothetical protein
VPVEEEFLAPKMSNVKRYVSRYRAGFRPNDLQFEVTIKISMCKRLMPIVSLFLDKDIVG